MIATTPTSTTNITPLDQPVEAAPKPANGALKETACKIAILAPKLIFSSAGWIAGFALGTLIGMPTIGAGLGDALGTFIGCLISALIESALQGKEKDFWNHRLKEAFVLSMGSLVAGMVFDIALEHFGGISSDFLCALAVGLASSASFVAGNSLGRAILLKDQEHGLSRKNL